MGTRKKGKQEARTKGKTKDSKVDRKEGMEKHGPQSRTRLELAAKGLELAAKW